MRFASMAFLVLAAFPACDGDPGEKVRDKYGQCYEFTGMECTGVREFYACIADACGTLLDACSSQCRSLFDCQRTCPCDSTNSQCLATCMNAASQDCKTCMAPAQMCIVQAQCQAPSCLSGEDPDVPAAGDAT